MSWGEDVSARGRAPGGGAKKNHTVFQVAERLREMRQARGWTLRDLAEQSRVSQGMLSKLESRSVNPSLSVIERIASAFGMSIGQFLGENHLESRYDVVFLPREKHRVLVNQVTGYTREELSPALHGAGIQLVRSTIAPGSGEIVFPPHAPNIEELIYLLKGRLRVTVGNQEYDLKEGDSIFLKPTVRHSYTNLGPEECVCFIVIDSHMAHYSE